MNTRHGALTALCCALLLSAVPALSADPNPARARDAETVYGYQLMTEQERAEHRDRMQSARTAEEREQIRSQHHERMKVRAKERGTSLPDEPSRQGGMMHGGGMGPKDGMGPGGGRGR